MCDLLKSSNSHIGVLHQFLFQSDTESKGHVSVAPLHTAYTATEQ